MTKNMAQESELLQLINLDTKVTGFKTVDKAYSGLQSVIQLMKGLWSMMISQEKSKSTVVKLT